MAENSGQPGEQVGIQPGEKIGKYEVVGRHSIGGQAIVYKARDPMLDRLVAIKQISTHLAEDPKFLERFRKEAQVLARLGAQHAEIVDIYELMEDERGLFIVMEWVEGHSLETIIADTDGPVEPRATLRVLWRLAAGLNAVHRAGIVHRDLKPGNIIVCEGLHPKITDFGVAASVSGQTSMVLGTTKYMAPELFEGEGFDARADIYSLGFIAYEMLVGRPKFREVFADVVRDRHSESLRWMKWHGNENVQAPPPAEVNPAVGRKLSDIVAKMMAKDPDERFQSMEELGRAIKLGFSTAARGAGPAAGQPEPASAGGRPDRVRELDEGGEDIGPGDEGDELDVAPEPAPTAPLPKRSLSLRTRIILLAVIVLSIVGIGVVFGIKAHQQRQQLSETASELYNRAYDEYREGDYAEALEGFQRVRREFAGTREAARASVFVPLTDAHVAVEQQNWMKAQAGEARATEQLKRVQSERPELLDWTRRMNREIENFNRYRVNQWTFRDTMNQAREEFEAGEYAEARDTLNRGLRSLALDAEQEGERAAFLQQVAVAEVTGQYDRLMEQGATFADRLEYDQARTAFTSARELLASEAAEVLDDEDRTRMRERVEGRIERLASNRAYAEAMEAAEQAVEAGDKGAELAALQRAVEIRPSEDLDERITTLQAEIALDRARRLRNEGDLEGARAALAESMEYKELPAAKEMLDAIGETVRRDRLVREGDAASAAGRLDEALEKYTQAVALESDDALRNKIADVRFRQQMNEASRLRENKQYDEAIATYEKAREINPAAGGQIDRILLAIEQQKRFESLLAEAAAARKARDWSKALEQLNKAKAIRDGEEVAEAIAETRYQMNRLLGQEALGRGDANGALGYFRLARQFKDTEEIDKLIAQAQEQIEE